MALLSRLRQSRFKFHAVSSEFKRFYNLNPGSAIANPHIWSSKLVPNWNYPKLITHDEQLAFFQKVRFYAKPLKKVAVQRDPSEPRLNNEITAPTIRLVFDEDKHVIISRHEALARANRDELDLVEVDKHAKPPVCKIFDYNKHKYLQQTKEKERAKSKSTLRAGAAKEIRFGGKIKLNDLKIKADMVKRLMDKGYRVKCTAVEAANDDFKTLLSQFTALIDDVAVVEGEAKYEKKQAFVVVRHVKFGPTKKGSGKKASDAADSVKTTEHPEGGARTDKSEWTAFDKDDGSAHSIFDIDDTESGQLGSSKQDLPYLVDKNARGVAEPAQARYPPPPIPSLIPKPAMDHKPGYQLRKPVGVNGRGASNTMNNTVPNQANRPSVGTNAPPMRPSQQVEGPPPRGILKQAPPPSSNPNPPPKSYGIFSVLKQESNAPSGSARNQRATGASPQRETPVADSSPQQGKWGIFSAETKENQEQKR